MSRRQDRRERRKEEIVSVATEMITTAGIDSFSVNRLAEELELTPGALYRYFDSRDHILAAVELEVLREFDAYFAAFEAQLASEEPLAHIVGLAFAYAALEELRPERFKLLSRFVSGPDPVVSDEAAESVLQPTLELLGRFATAYQAATDAGELDDELALQRAALTWSCVQGVLDRRKLNRFTHDLFDLEALLVDLLASLLVGWGADRAAVEHALTQRPKRAALATLLEPLLEDT